MLAYHRPPRAGCAKDEDGPSRSLLFDKYCLLSCERNPISCVLEYIRAHTYLIGAL